MSIELPKGIADYFSAERSRSAEEVSRCFTETAVVRDEGSTYKGRDAIRGWKADASKKYNYTVEPFAVETEVGQTLVTSHIVGDFPGSPVDLRYTFVLDGEKIAELGITL